MAVPSVVEARNSPRSHNVLTMGSRRMINPIVAGMVIKRMRRILKPTVWTNSLRFPFAAWLDSVGRRATPNATANIPRGSCTSRLP